MLEPACRSDPAFFQFISDAKPLYPYIKGPKRHFFLHSFTIFSKIFWPLVKIFHPSSQGPGPGPGGTGLRRRVENVFSFFKTRICFLSLWALPKKTGKIEIEKLTLLWREDEKFCSLRNCRRHFICIQRILCSYMRYIGFFENVLRVSILGHSWHDALTVGSG